MKNSINIRIIIDRTMRNFGTSRVSIWILKNTIKKSIVIDETKVGTSHFLEKSKINKALKQNASIKIARAKNQYKRPFLCIKGCVYYAIARFLYIPLQ